MHSLEPFQFQQQGPSIEGWPLILPTQRYPLLFSGQIKPSPAKLSLHGLLMYKFYRSNWVQLALATPPSITASAAVLAGDFSETRTSFLFMGQHVECMTPIRPKLHSIVHRPCSLRFTL